MPTYEGFRSLKPEEIWVLSNKILNNKVLGFFGPWSISMRDRKPSAEAGLQTTEHKPGASAASAGT